MREHKALAVTLAIMLSPLLIALIEFIAWKF